MPWPFIGLAGVLAMVAVMWMPRRLRSLRSQLAKCTHCGYSRLGLDDSRPCPECGNTVISSGQLRRLRQRAGVCTLMLLASWCLLPGKLGGYACWQHLWPWQHVERIALCSWTIDVYTNSVYSQEAGWLTSSDAMPTLEPHWRRNGHPVLLRVRSSSGSQWSSQAEGWRLVHSDAPLVRGTSAESEVVRIGAGRDSFLLVLTHYTPGIFSQWNSFALFDCNDATGPSQSGDEFSTGWADTDTMSFDSKGVYVMAHEEIGCISLPLLARPVSNHLRSKSIPDDLEPFAVDWESTLAYYRAKLDEFAQQHEFDSRDDESVVQELIRWTRRPRSAEMHEDGGNWFQDIEDLRAVVAEEVLRGRADRAVRIIREEFRTRSPTSQVLGGQLEWPPVKLTEYRYSDEIKSLQIAPWPQ